MPLIPAGTKFEAIKPTTNVNRRSALVNANDLTYTIADIAATVGGNVTVPFTNVFPKVNNVGSFVASKLYNFNVEFKLPVVKYPLVRRSATD